MSKDTYPSDHAWFESVVGAIVLEVMGDDDPVEKLRMLPSRKKVLFHVGQFIVGYYDGGIDGYLSGPNGDEIQACWSCLKLIGAHRAAEFVEAVIGFFPDGFSFEDAPNLENAVREVCRNEGVRLLDDVEKIKKEEIFENLEAVISLLRAWAVEL
jgi:hypothetical protein